MIMTIDKNIEKTLLILDNLDKVDTLQTFGIRQPLSGRLYTKTINENEK